MEIKKVHYSLYDYISGKEYKFGKYTYRVDLVDIEKLDDKKYYTFNVYRKRFLFWVSDKVISSFDADQCRKEYNEYFKKLAQDNEGR